MATKQLDSYAQDWIKLRSLTLAKSINKTTLEALRHELALGFEAGESIQQLTKRIGKWFDDTKQWKAEQISRTEVLAAYNEGNLHRFEIEGVKMVEWMASPSACDECFAFDAQVFDTANSHGMIPLHPNCRCTWLMV